MKHQMNGTLTAESSHHYLSHRFNVPGGATRLDIDFQYAPKRVGNYGNLVTLSLFEPNGDRGAGHRGRPNQHITAGTGAAAPCHIPRALAPRLSDITNDGT